MIPAGCKVVLYLQFCHNTTPPFWRDEKHDAVLYNTLPQGYYGFQFNLKNARLCLRRCMLCLWRHPSCLHRQCAPDIRQWQVTPNLYVYECLKLLFSYRHIPLKISWSLVVISPITQEFQWFQLMWQEQQVVQWTSDHPIHAKLTPTNEYSPPPCLDCPTRSPS